MPITNSDGQIRTDDAIKLAALLIGERRLIDDNRLPRDSSGNVQTARGGGEFFSFHVLDYDPVQFKEVTNRLKKLVEDNDYEFGFMNKCRDPESKEEYPCNVSLTIVRTYPQEPRPHIFAFLSYKSEL
jgi:hypothetical protein